MIEPVLGERRRLLLVDDQPLNVRMLAEALKNEHELSFATSGERALELAAAGGVDLVLLDVVMPGLDGFEVCRRLKADPLTAKIPVIFVTASDETEQEARGFEVGGVDYITKPIQPLTVRARVRTHLELKAARDLLEQLALIDPLTGIPNRRRFDAALLAEWHRATRIQRPLSLAVLDVDYFKRYNDTYGHARGDDCLRSLARCLAETVRRPSDLGARFGGEEFALLAPDTDAEGMTRLLAGLLRRIGELGMEHRASEVSSHVTVSIGAVTLLPAAHETTEAASQAAFALADSLLYEAKAAGRARAIHFDQQQDARQTLAFAPARGERPIIEPSP